MPSIDLSRYKQKDKKKTAPERGLSFSKLLSKDISFGSSLSDGKKESFYTELSTLLQSGIDIKTSLELIAVEQERNQRELFEQVGQTIVGGKSLSEALRATGQFGDYEYFTLRIGEETGKLVEVMLEIAAYFKSRIHQRRKIIGAITYPAIVLCTSMGAVFFMIHFVVPMFADVFIRFGGKLPWLTQFILTLSGVFTTWFPVIFLLFLGLIALAFTYRKVERFRAVSSSLLLRVPLAGEMIRKIYLSRMCNSLRLLLSTEIPLLRAIAMVRQMVGFYPIEQALKSVETEVLKGHPLHASMAKFSIFPPKMVQLIKVGEEVNRLAYFFEKISTQYTEDVEHKTNTLSSLMEPFIIIFLGLVVGTILIAMYLPMFQISDSF